MRLENIHPNFETPTSDRGADRERDSAVNDFSGMPLPALAAADDAVTSDVREPASITTYPVGNVTALRPRIRPDAGGAPQPGSDLAVHMTRSASEAMRTYRLPSNITGHRPRLRKFSQSTKLQDVSYEIRGPVHDHAARLESEGHRILKLNIGNPAPFGFEAPDVIMRDIIQALPYAQGYSDSKGILSARRAVVTRYELVAGFPDSTSITSTWAMAARNSSP